MPTRRMAHVGLLLVISPAAALHATPSLHAGRKMALSSSASAAAFPHSLILARGPRRGREPVASAAVARSFAAPLGTLLSRPLAVGALLLTLGAFLFTWLKRSLYTPSRVYEDLERESGGLNSVSREYDAWTSEGILEYYWGEHIHLGYYPEGQRKAPFYGGKNFIEAKYDFIDKMLEFSQADSPKTILDVGCGFGGTSRTLAKKYPEASIKAITISPEQQKRATELAVEQGVGNAEFMLMDALNMDFPDNSFDLVWACESGEHMPDKERYVQEMSRVLKPGGRIVIATWCEREADPPFTPEERKVLDYLYGEWSHPYFVSIQEYDRIMKRTGVLDQVQTDNWSAPTIPSWRHSFWVGVWDPWPVFRRPHIWWKTVRDTWCLEVMHRAFTSGLMEYGMMTATKKLPA